jgi:hypothetical protein
MPLVALHRLSVAVASTTILFMIWAAPPGKAEGIIYAVPNHPPPEKESVNFTNHLNHRVRHLPDSLDPPTAETPAQVEARVRTLERGVVIEPGKGRGRPAGHHAQATAKASKVGGGESSGSGSRTTAPVAGDPAPLTVAFVGAGALAVLGLLLSARGMRRHVRTG